MRKIAGTAGKQLGFWALVASSFLFIAISVAHAQQPIDMTSCGDLTATTIIASEALTIMGTQGRGITLDNLSSKVFENMTYQSVGVMKIDGGKMTATFYSKYMEPSGDFAVIEISQTGTERDWKFLYGTGKWKGVTGAGKAFAITNAKPITPGTSQGCHKVTGTYELKK